MSNAVPTLAAAAAFVQQPDPSTPPKEVVAQAASISNKSSSTSTSPAPASNSKLSTGSSEEVTTESEPSSSAAVAQLNLSMTNNATSTVTTTEAVNSNHSQSQPPATIMPVNPIKPNGKANYYHPNQHQQRIQDMNQQHFLNHHPIPINLNHFNTPLNGPGLQYIQLNSNSNSTSMSNGSPLSSSLTSSPSTVNSSIQYLNHQPPQTSHLPKSYQHHGPPSAPPIYAQQQQQQHQQFQQLQQFNSQFQPNYKDTRWLTLEVCREFQRNKCNRNETECKFAHPPPHVEIINGKVIACYDSLKGKCTRKEPPCKYLHPPQHLKDQLLQNGKNNLVLRQVALAMMQQQQHQQQTNVQTNTSDQHTSTAALLAAATTRNNQYASYNTSPSSTNSSTSSVNGVPQFYPSLAGYQPVQLANGQHLLQMIPNGYPSAAHQLGHNIYANDPNSTLLQQVSHNSTISPPVLNNTSSILPPQQRTDRLQICKDHQKSACTKTASECALAHPPPHCPVDQENSLVTVCVDFIKGKCSRENCKYFHPPEHLVAHLKKLKLTNNALAAAAYAAASNQQVSQTAQLLGPLSASHFSPIQHQYNFGPTASVAQHFQAFQPTQSTGQLNTYNPFRLNNHRSYDTPNNLQLLSEHLQRQRQQQQQQFPQHLLTNRINAYNEIAYLRSASSHTNSSQTQAQATSNKPAAAPATAASTTTTSTTSITPATAASAVGTSHNSQIGDINDTNGAIVTLDNGQTYQLPQYQMYQQVLQQRPKNNNSSSDENGVDNNHANGASATNATTANTLVDNGPSKKRQHDAIDQDFNPMTSGNIYSASNVKRTALTDTKTGMPIFQPLGQSSMHHLAGPGLALPQAHLHPSHQQQHLALAPQLGGFNYQPVALNASQMSYAQYPPVMSLPYIQTGMPRL